MTARTAKDANSYAAEEQRSLDFVQRVIASSSVGLFVGSIAVVLAAYLALGGASALPRDSVIGLWVMTGVIGLLAMAGVLVLHRRRWYSPVVLVGLLPMAVSAYWIL